MTNSPLTWSTDYSVGDQTIDEQHRKLLSICSHIDHIKQDGTPQFLDQFYEELNGLIVYAEEHFKFEEDLFESKGFPDTEKHKHEHDEYFKQVSKILFDAQNGKIELEELKTFILGWWIDHILNSDMKYKPYLEKKS